MDLHPTVEGCGQGEDQVVIGHRQHRRALAFTPCRGGTILTAWAMPIATGMIKDRAIPAAVAFQRKAAQGGGAAVPKVMTDLPLAGA
jgi:hypothetical protein